MGKRNCNPFDYYNSEFQRERKKVLSCAIFTVTGISYIDISLGSKIARLESFRERERERASGGIRSKVNS